MSQKPSKREQRHARQQRAHLMSNLIWGGLGIVVLAIIGFIVWRVVRPLAGEAMPVMPASHIETDSDPGQYNSDPPTSGPHYPQPLNAGFYDTNNYKYPAGYLVHNLEHGYVVFWYNCGKLSEGACTDLKAKIKTVMDDLGGTKLVAYPWPSLDATFAMTSWGQLEKFETFDAVKAKAFVRANLKQAPEPDAP
jgi:hypothetical protein